ncbi:MAG: spore coat U domain-containing protein [Pseudomonadota bacterium]
MNKAFRASLISAACLAAFGAASAATDTTNMTVKITVTATCDIHTVAPTDVDFGSVASTATNVASTGGVLSVKCTTGTPYTIGLDNGLNFSTTRQMKNGTANFVGYGLFRDAAFATAWGSTVPLSASGTGNGANQNFTVYGRVPSAASAAGAYTDTVVATVTY